MTTPRSSSSENVKTRVRVETKPRRRVGRRSRNLDVSSSPSSEDERNQNRSREGRRDRGKEYGRPSHRERRSSTTRRRKRSPSPSRHTRKKIRSISDSDSPHSRSRSTRYYSHRQCKHSSFHKRHWQRSGCSRHDDRCCVSYYYSERENRICSKRKERRSRSPLNSQGGKHRRSRSRDSISYGSNSKTLRTSKVRRQTSCGVKGSQGNPRVQSDSDSPRKHSSSGKVLTRGGPQPEYGPKLPPTENGRPFPPSLRQLDADLEEKLRSRGGFTSEVASRLGERFGRSVPRNYGEDQLVKPGCLGSVLNESSDWLDLSLKAPAKPTPKIEGISREDLRLSLDSSMAPAATLSEALGDAKMATKLEKQDDDKAPSTSRDEGGFEASLYGTSFFSVQVGVPIFRGSLSGTSNLLDVACPGENIMQEKATSSLKNGKNFSPLDQNLDAGTSGSPLEHEQKTKEERCFFLLNQLISMSEDKDELVPNPDTDLLFSGSLKKQPVIVTISSEQEPLTDTGITGPTRADMSVSVVDLSNSVSTQQHDVETADMSGDNKEVSSTDCYTSFKEKVEVCTGQGISAMPVDPSTLSQTPGVSKSVKTSIPTELPWPVVELSDSTTMHEGDDDQASEIQSQPGLPSAVSQLNETSEKFDPLPTSVVKDQRSVRASCPQDSSTDRTFFFLNSDAAVERTDKVVVQELSDLDHATDLFIDNVHSLLNHARPHSPPLVRRPNLSSSQKEILAGRPVSKQKIGKEDPSTSRRGSIEVVELSDSSSAPPSSSSDESDSEIEVALSSKRCYHKCEKTQQSAEMVNDHPMQYVNEDVVCCSIKPPLKRCRDSYGADQGTRRTYIRDKHGNLIQVVNVEDSDIEDDGEELDTKSCEEDKEDAFFSSHPQVLPVIEEIKEMLQGENSTMEKSSDTYGHSEPSSPRMVKVTSSARTQIPSRRPSQSKRARKLVLEGSDSHGSDDDTEAAVGGRAVTSTVGLKPGEKWKRGIVCDLCSLGPSLALGEWYCWCCGIAATKCQCPEELKLKKQLSVGYRKGQKLKKRGKQILCYQWSGKVHKMCALWSSEKSSLQLKPKAAALLSTSVWGQRDNVSSVDDLVKSFLVETWKVCGLEEQLFRMHQKKISSKFKVYVKQSPKREPHFAQLETAVKRGNGLTCKHPDCKKSGATLGCRVRPCRRSYHYPCAEKLANQCMVRMWDGVLVPIACQYHRHVEEQAERARDIVLRSKITDPVRDGKTVVPAERPYIGVKLLCEDMAQGQEQVQIPCTNDVDDDSAPSIRYITKCWFKGRPVDHLHPVGTELAKGCQGCAGPNFDNPHTTMPLHVVGADKTSRSREVDDRLDWQGERMYGRLPYNSAGLLQLGPDSKDIVECNSRCKCGPKCKNREVQKGLRCHLELFKTKDRGWGVRTLEQIPRGKFVVEYVGDVLTQAEADERGEKYDQNQLSYLFNLDHPGVPHGDAIVLDGITMSNIARFINHSCEGNLMIFRVFSETNDLRYFRIGMYAIQDIEIGDELSYDYNYALSKDSSEMVDDPTAIRCFCGAQTCRKWLWQGGDSGLKH